MSWLAKLAGLNIFYVKFGLFILFLCALVVGKCSYDRSIIEADRKAENERLREVGFEAGLEAAHDRGRDEANIANDERNRLDEIYKAPDSKPAAARNALNCERLRRAGQDTSRIAACAGLGD